MYDLAIIGGGPAGVAGGVYAARKKMKTVLITDFFGGQSLVSADIQNWIGVVSISGFEWGKKLEEHLRAQESIDIMDSDLVSKVERMDGGWRLLTQSGKAIEAKTMLLTSGSRRRKLNVPGEKEFESRGVAYCSICDAPLFKDRAVVVAGGGNSGLEATIDLLPYATKIFLLHRGDVLKGDPVTQEKVVRNPKVQVILNVEIQEIIGSQIVTGLKYRDKISSDVRMLDVQGVFVEIGSVPNSDFVKEFVKLNDWGEVVVDHKTQRTSVEGIWAAGDITDVMYKQNNISMGDAVKATLNIYEYFRSR
ncbi:FAD-dependent oxidoreductase [Candidatus Jorgensenbacteria bacterium]|nr:FAD-dependent oxidoreductase [Candidatus Jorgensenbacteria bacterium]